MRVDNFRVADFRLESEGSFFLVNTFYNGDESVGYIDHDGSTVAVVKGGTPFRDERTMDEVQFKAWIEERLLWYKFIHYIDGILYACEPWFFIGVHQFFVGAMDICLTCKDYTDAKLVYRYEVEYGMEWEDVSLAAGTKDSMTMVLFYYGLERIKPNVDYHLVHYVRMAKVAKAVFKHVPEFYYYGLDRLKSKRITKVCTLFAESMSEHPFGVVFFNYPSYKTMTAIHSTHGSHVAPCDQEYGAKIWAMIKSPDETNQQLGRSMEALLAEGLLQD